MTIYYLMAVLPYFFLSFLFLSLFISLTNDTNRLKQKKEEAENKNRLSFFKNQPAETAIS